MDKGVYESLNDILSSEFPLGYYSIGGYGDEAVCIEQTDDGWKVYTGFRGQKDNVKIFSNIVEASLAMLDCLSDSDEKSRLLRDRFLNLIETTK